MKIHPMAAMDKSTNMYGCTRCPKCGDNHRYRRNDSPDMVSCDECEYQEPVDEDNCSY